MRVLFATLFIVIADQLTKFLVKGGSIPFINWNVKGMEYAESFNVIGDFFKITFVENPGLAFGIDINDTSKLILSIFTLFASLGIFYYLYKSLDQKFIVRLALAFILGGAIGNLIDRTFYGVFYGYAPIFYGKVVDFFNVDFFDFTIFGRTYDRWPIFNIADASVTIGVILLIIFHRNPDEKTETESIANNEVALSSSSVEGESISEAVQNDDVAVNENSQIENGKVSNREENIN